MIMRIPFIALPESTVHTCRICFKYFFKIEDLASVYVYCTLFGRKISVSKERDLLYLSSSGTRSMPVAIVITGIIDTVLQ